MPTLHRCEVVDEATAKQAGVLAISDYKLTYSPHGIFGEIPNLFFVASCERDGREEVATYVFDGLMSSILLWKECCVGVAADTETVDELCIVVRMCAEQQRGCCD
jgi:hypothetical protein